METLEDRLKHDKQAFAKGEALACDCLLALISDYGLTNHEAYVAWVSFEKEVSLGTRRRVRNSSQAACAARLPLEE